jgi:hypothetical protein
MPKSLRETAFIAAAVIVTAAATTVANPIDHHPLRTQLTVQQDDRSCGED